MAFEGLQQAIASRWYLFALLFLCALPVIVNKIWARSRPKARIPVSVNYFFTRRCNAECGFCFHTAKTSYVAPMEDAKRGLALLKQAGMLKINFAGGEPFLYPKYLAELLVYCRDTLNLESISIISNGSFVDEAFLKKYAKYVDVLGISCDSFNEDVNVKIGRTNNGKPMENVKQLFRIAEWCRRYDIKFKLNTVVCKWNWDEDMTEPLSRLKMFRWKVFQVLLVPGENTSNSENPDVLRNAEKLLITDAQFKDFCDRHRHVAGFVPESNELMKDSYLLIDEYWRFMDNDRGSLSSSILEVGVDKALSQIKWSEDRFYERGGLYDWGKEDVKQSSCGTDGDKAFEMSLSDDSSDIDHYDYDSVVPKFTPLNFCHQSCWFQLQPATSKSVDNVECSPAFPFMKLPLEIRSIIYELLLESPCRMIFFGEAGLPVAYKRLERVSEECGHQFLTADLLRVSKALYEEAWPILLKNNCLVLGHGDYSHEMRALPKRFIPHIKSVELHLDGAELCQRLGDGYKIQQLNSDMEQCQEWNPTWRLDFANWEVDKRRIRLNQIHTAQFDSLCAAWGKKSDNVVRLKPETWFLNVVSCYCQHSCCRMAEEAIIIFCRALHESLRLRTEEEGVHEEYTPKFWITGLWDFEYQKAWEAFNAVYCFSRTDQRLRQGKRVLIGDYQKRERELERANLIQEEFEGL